MRVQTAALAALAALLAFGVPGCGGGGGGPAAPSGPGVAQPPAATITISASGVNPKTTRIETGQVVRFVNSDGSTHVPSSDPHPTHTDCPAINAAGTLTPGANGSTSPLNAARSCGFHDHNNPDDSRFRGQIVVGNAPELPGY